MADLHLSKRITGTNNRYRIDLIIIFFKLCLEKTYGTKISPQHNIGLALFFEKYEYVALPKANNILPSISKAKTMKNKQPIKYVTQKTLKLFLKRSFFDR